MATSLKLCLNHFVNRNINYDLGEHFFTAWDDTLLFESYLSLEQGYHFIHLRKPYVLHLKALVSLLKVISILYIVFFSRYQYLLSEGRAKILSLLFLINEWLCLTVKVIIDKISKRSKGYAFIEYTTEEAASAALKEMNGKVEPSFFIA